MIKTLHRVGTKGAYLNIIKAIYDKSIADIILSVEKPESISSKIRNEVRGSTLATIIQHSFESPSSHSNPRRQIKGIQLGKEVKQPLFADNRILYIENPNDATRKIISANQ